MYCSACRVESGPTLFCHVCDNYLPSPVTGLKAGLVRRFIAVILDGIVAATILALSIRTILLSGGRQSSAQVAVFLISSLALLTYVVGFFSALSLGMTPGKWFLGIRAIDKRNGGAPGLGRMFVREIIGKVVSGFFLGLGFFWAIWDRDGQAWHDKVAGTVIVRNYEVGAANKPSNASPIAVCVAFFVMLCLQFVNVVDPKWTADSQRPTTVSTQPSTDPLPSEPVVSSVEHEAKSTTETIDPNQYAAPSRNDQVESPSSGELNQSLTADSKTQIATLLTGWASAIAANDPPTESNFYADEVDRYFLARNLTRADVLREKEATLSSGRRANYFQIET